MIIEGLVTTRTPSGTLHVAPMGPAVEGEFTRLVLKPFPTSQTYRNLLEHPEGVFHLSDDVLLLARAALGKIDAPPPHMPARSVEGFILMEACRYFEFRILSVDDRGERVRMEAEVLGRGDLRPFIGFNRARNAVVEAAILATRTHFLPLADVDKEFRKLAVIIEKTGGERERDAMALLQAHLDAEIVRQRQEGGGRCES